MKKRILSFILIFSLILPLGIGLAHAFHQHENQQCLAKNESHIHAEKSDCSDVHYFSQSVGDWQVDIHQLLSFEDFHSVSFGADQALVIILPSADQKRGPPFIMTF